MVEITNFYASDICGAKNHGQRWKAYADIVGISNSAGGCGRCCKPISNLGQSSGESPRSEATEDLEAPENHTL